MATMDPAAIPSHREHLDENDRRRLEAFELLLTAGQLEAAKDVAEDLWSEATDAHRRLYQGLANALTAAIAASAGHLRGAAEVAARTRTLLAPFPRHALGLDALLDDLCPREP